MNGRILVWLGEIVNVPHTLLLKKLIRCTVVSAIGNQVIAQSPASADPHPQPVSLLCAYLHGEIKRTGDYSMFGPLGVLSTRMCRCIVR